MAVYESDEGICIDGFKAAGVRRGRYGLALIACDRVCRTAGVFTRNNIKAAPLQLNKRKLDAGFQAVVANSGNANACVSEGLDDAEMMCAKAAEELNISKKNVGVASTGIIGKRLDMDLINELIGEAAGQLTSSAEGSTKAAQAIMTTDKTVKMLSIEYKGIKVGAIAKGAGMIAPDMATMLCFISTNADLRVSELQDALTESVDESFNMLSIDEDMSTNDMVLLLSTATAECNISDFKHALNYLTREMAIKMAKDGEGSTKYLQVEVKGALTKKQARKGAKAIISSNLVKTALHGENPNWGRITAALGSKIGYLFAQTDIIFSSGAQKALVLEKGVVGDLETARKVLAEREIKLTVNLNQGEYKATAYGCDLSPEYVEINAKYS
ncbi:MAG: bifunctional ornithine acetyltransferase/N-acetylglutamate synthase [Candidatus Altiarchaeales archaeon ex4484_96]|nr:MAG: bifunctional ornithine acetyltransferase/N-acetylglutamate synthase [Candidatus Altiarchaeales archaeon ex4484_96]